MKKAINGLLAIALVILVGLLGFIIWENYVEADPNGTMSERTPELDWTPPPLDTPDPTPDPTPTPDQIAENAATMTLAIAGDIVLHSGLNTEAEQEDGSYDYSAVMGGATSYLRSADFSVACLETTFTSGPEYKAYPLFMSPDGFATSLSDIGVDLVSTANNHSVDSGKAGISRTLDVLEANGIAHVGTYRSQDDRDAQNGITVAEANGISMAFLAYTYGTNGIPVTGFEYAVNVFHEDYMTNLSVIKYDMIKEDLAAARELGTDLIIVYMHWGYEYNTSPVDYQYELADLIFAEGADIIIGGHPHVPEPMELRQVIDNEGNEKTGYICYCLGNFISCQNDPYTNLSAIVHLRIEKNLDTGETYILGVKYAPMFMVDLEDYGVFGAPWRYRLWDLHAAIGSYEAGNNMGAINEKLYDAMVQGLEDIHSIMGREYDSFYDTGD